MGIVKRQGIKASVLVYIGFALGALNILIFFPKIFTEEQVGLTRVLSSTTITFAQLCLLGVPAIILKFYPYYKDHARNKNDVLFLSTLVAFIGTIIVSSVSFIFYDDVLTYFSKKSPLLSEYFYLTFVSGIFTVAYTIFETYSRSNLKNVLPIFLRELGLRIYTTLLIALFYFNLIDFHQFVWLFALYFFVAMMVMVIDLYRSSMFQYDFKISKVTTRLKSKMLSYGSFIYGGGLFAIVADNIDTILIAGIAGLKSTGIFTIASYIATILQIPQRTISNISTPILARSWKEKDYKNIQYLYEKSSLNQLIFGLCLFLLIWLNIDLLFQFLPASYADGKYVLLIMCITRLIDLGTGVNGEILITSNMWRFNFITHILLVALSIPMNYFFISKYGIIGSAYSNLIAYSAYNSTRFIFIWKKYGMQPFSMKTFYVLILALISFSLAEFISSDVNIWLAAVLKTIVVVLFFVIPIIYFKISEDFRLLYHQVINRFKNLIKNE